MIILIGKKHIFFCNYEMIYSNINASMKWRNVYIFFKEKRIQQKYKTDNVEEIITSVYSFYLKKYESVLREYFLYAKLFKHFSNYHFHF